MITDVQDITSFKWATVTGIGPVAIQLDGDTSPLALIPESIIDPAALVVGDRVRVELSLRKCVIHGKSSGVASMRGTSSQRDALFGVPATDPARAALANKKVVWFNTDLGWEESYFGTTALSGLTAKGLITGVPHGWYPIGPGPYMRLQPTSTFTTANSTAVKNWNGTTRRNGGAAWFTYDNATGRVTVVLGGRYRVSAWTTQNTGSGTSLHQLWQRTGGTVEWQVDGLAVAIDAGFYTHLAGDQEDMPILPNRTLELYTSNGGIVVHQGAATTLRGEFAVTYLGPALVSD